LAAILALAVQTAVVAAADDPFASALEKQMPALLAKSRVPGAVGDGSPRRRGGQGNDHGFISGAVRGAEEFLAANGWTTLM